MSTRPDPPVIDRNDPQVLLGLLETFPEPVIVGFEPSHHHVDLHVAPLPHDDRCGAAGLFGARAAPGWTAVGVVLAGRARNTVTHGVVDPDASAAVVVTSSGHCASRLQLSGSAVEGGAEGLVVDALHRVVGLPAPGEAVPPALLALTMWTHQILEQLLARGAVSWPEALALHPGEPGAGPIGPSTEMLVEATVRAADGFRWPAMHARAASGATRVHALSSAEAAWMDATMFSRWVLSSLPEPGSVVGLLRTHGCEAAADRLERVVEGITGSGPP